MVVGHRTYHEEGKGVQRKRHRMESKSIQPHLKILECVQHRGPGEFLIVHGIIVVSQSELDELSLLLGQELGGCWVVVNPEVGSNGHDHGQETFLFSISRVAFGCSPRVFGGLAYQYENPSPAIIPPDAFHMRNALSQSARILSTE